MRVNARVVVLLSCLVLYVVVMSDLAIDVCTDNDELVFLMLFFNYNVLTVYSTNMQAYILYYHNKTESLEMDKFDIRAPL